MLVFLLLGGGWLPSVQAQLIINEVSFGWGNPTSRQYIELVVNCDNDPQLGSYDIRGIIVDDNSGRGSTCDSDNSSITGGHMRFANVDQWDCVPCGAIIVIYNEQSRNQSLPSDDPVDANNDLVYIVPANSELLIYNPDFPNTSNRLLDDGSSMSNCNYFGTAGRPGSRSHWNSSVHLTKSGDLIQVVDPNTELPIHLFAFGTSTHGDFNDLTPPAYPTGVYFDEEEQHFSFKNFQNDNPFHLNNWQGQSAYAAESPGEANSNRNETWINSLRTHQPQIGAVEPLCLNDNPIYLQATPNGGTWDGPYGAGAYVGGYFDPATHEGWNTLSYTVTDARGCEHRTTIEILVESCVVYTCGHFTHPTTVSDEPDFNSYPYRDRFGNQYTDIAVPTAHQKLEPLADGSNGIHISAGGRFKVHFSDVIDNRTINGEGFGFNDPNDGEAYCNNVMEVFNYLENLFTFATNDPDCAPEDHKVIIEIKASRNTDIEDTITLASASAYYKVETVTTNNNIVHGDVWHAINTGLNDTSTWDGCAQFNFHESFTWHTDWTTENEADKIDLYAVTLHELGHMLGFASFLDTLTDSIPDAYTRYDSYLERSDNESILLNVNPNNRCASQFHKFNTKITPPSNFTTGCDETGFNINFVGSSTTAIHTPKEYREGSSMSHIETNCDGNPTENFVMHHSFGPGEKGRREFTPTEQEILCDLGYNLAICNPTPIAIADNKESCCASSNAFNLDLCGSDIGDNGFAEINIQDIICNDANIADISCFEAVSPSNANPVRTDDRYRFTYRGVGQYVFQYTPQNANGEEGLPARINLTIDPNPRFTFDACGLTVSFNSSTELTDAEHIWHFGDGSDSSTLANPVHTYQTTEDSMVYQIVHSIIHPECNFISTDTVEITVRQAVLPDPSFAHTADDCGFTINFTPVYEEGGHIWDFGDGTGSTEVNPTHMYPEGEYIVEHTVIINCGVVMHVDTITVAPSTNFDVSLDFNIANFCLGNPINLPGVSTTNPPNGTFSIVGQTVNELGIFEPTAAGVYTVRYTYKDSVNGCMGMAEANILVSNPPNAAFTYIAPDCESTSARFEFHSEDTDGIHLWSFGDGATSDDFDPIHTYTNTDQTTYEVIHTVTNECSSDSDTLLVELNSTGVVAGLSQTTFCVKSTVGSTIFIDEIDESQPSGGVFSGDIIIEGIQGGVTYYYFNRSPENAGEHDIIYTVTQGDCTASDTITIIIEYPLDPDFSYTTNDCENGDLLTVQFFSVNTTGQHIWDFGDGDSSDEVNPVYTYENTGEYEVTHIIYGCDTVEVTQTITIGGDAISFEILQESFCTGETISLTNNEDVIVDPVGGVFSGDGVTLIGSNYFFTAPDNDMDSTAITYTYTNEAGCTNTATIAVEVQAEDDPEFSTEVVDCRFEVQFTANQQDGLHTWDFGDGNRLENTSLANPIHTYDGPGTYTIMHSIKTDCGTTESEPFTLTLTDEGNSSLVFEDEIFCVGEPVDLTTVPTTAPMPDDIVFDGDRVLSNVFAPNEAKEYELFYTYTTTGCLVEGSVIVQAVSGPEVTLELDGQSFCTGRTYDLTTLGIAQPTGGDFSGDHIQDNIFNPLDAHSQSITYTYIDDNNCTSTETIDITVQEASSCSATDQIEACIASNADSYHIQGEYRVQNSTWSNGSNPFGNTTDPIRINGTLIVPSGITLNVTNMELQFTLHSKVVIEVGGELQSLGTKFTGDPQCQTMWEGIEVWGPGGLVTTNTNESTGFFLAVQLNNQPTIIEHAIVGVAAQSMNIEVLGPATNKDLFNSFVKKGGKHKYGGRIVARNTTFRNCYQSVNLCCHLVTTAIESGFSECIFECPDNLRYPGTTAVNKTSIHINSSITNHINCTENIFTDATDYGIHITETLHEPQIFRANHIIMNPNTNGTGIYCDYASPIQTTTTQGVLFNKSLASGNKPNIIENAYIGVDIRGSKFTQMEDITFKNNVHSLVLAGSDFKVENNVFTGNNDTETMITLINNGSFISEIKNNTFDGTYEVGLCAAGNNENVNVTCNTFDGYKDLAWDIMNEEENTISTLAVFSDQVECNQDNTDFSETGDNIFIPNGLSTGNDIAATTSFIYYYRQDASSEFIPGSTSPLVDIDECLDVSYVDCELAEMESQPDLFTCALSNSSSLVKNRCANLLLQQYDELEQFDQSIYLLQTMGTKPAIKEVVKYQVQLQQWDNATTTLQSIPIDNQEDDNFVRYHTVHVQLGQSGRTVLDLTASETETLRDIADDYTTTSFAAQATLGAVYGEKYPLQLPNRVQNKQRQTSPKSTQLLPYPNPANTIIYIPYQVENNSELHLYNSLGQLVYTTTVETGLGELQLPVETLPNGIYMYTWQTNEKVTHSSKFTIIR